jgi:hypothetical protein
MNNRASEPVQNATCLGPATFSSSHGSLLIILLSRLSVDIRASVFAYSAKPRDFPSFLYYIILFI